MNRPPVVTVLIAFAAGLAACNTVPTTEADQRVQDAEVEAALVEFQAADPDLESFFKTAAGYAVFPTVGKGAWWVGGAYGRGQVFKEGGEMIGWCDLIQATIGLQAGGQAYRELIFFQTDGALTRFTGGEFELSAQASAVAATAGASLDVPYRNGVAVFTLAQGGLMYEASVGGQKFDFVPKP
jgi:lipid-binding SYLF domain-containing protein